jgi:3-(3-hydroxy-phenyl)propionate hydroxylase
MNVAPIPHHQIAIVGAGPTGLTLANLLGRLGIPTLLIERHETTVTEPRAVSIDDESLRTMQAAGLIEAVLRDVVPGYGSHYHGPNGRCFAKVEPTGTPFGYPRRNAFRQPVLERQLRDNLHRFACVTTCFGWTLTDFAAASDRVHLTLTDPSQEARSISCDYLIGCDGASSLVRERLGIVLGGTTFDERWLIVDLENHPNTERHTRVFCDSRRPCITLPGPHDTRRFEFKLRAGERDADLLDPAMVDRLLAAHGADPRATIRRKVVYRFHARVADRWSAGRVFLAGDAAHLTPPFAGQGMNSGIRDAHNLAWKLACVLRGQAGAGLLDTYAQERRDHVWAMIRLALRMGTVMGPPSRIAGLAIRSAFTALRLWPPASDYVLQMKYKPKPRFNSGFLIGGGAARAGLVGRLFPQPSVRRTDGSVVLLDDVLGQSFCLLARTSDPDEVFSRLRHDVWKTLDARRVAILPAGAATPRGGDVAVVAETDDGPAGLFGRRSDAILLLRPDHYVAAAFTLPDADETAAAIQRLLDATRLGDARPDGGTPPPQAASAAGVISTASLTRESAYW